MQLLEAALNGDREHPAVPRTPEELARDARATVDAGATVLHLHPFDEEGRQTLQADDCAAALLVVRSTCPGIPLSLSTSEAIEPDPERKLALIAAWTELPDLVTVNQGEPGVAEVTALLTEKGIGIEAGLLSTGDAHAFVTRGVGRCIRALIEPLDPDPQAAVAHAAVMEEILAAAHVTIEQVHHGDGIASWSVNRRAAARGHGIRTGLEDTPVLAHGRRCRDNAELVAAAADMLRGS